jgi:hypothetical protein
MPPPARAAMAEPDPVGEVRAALLAPQGGLHFAPIRHHSPACAWAVRALIRAVRPARVLIEAPEDLAGHIALLLHPETRPPVAIAALADVSEGGRVAAYYPFCVHAPEFVAIREAQAVGAEVRFIDLPVAAKLNHPTHATLFPRDRPVSLTAEPSFNSGDFIRGLCRRTGCRDGHELWDHLFETRLGEPDFARFLADVGAYCAGIRAATRPEQIDSDGDAAREAHMAASLLAARGAGGPLVVITGGFHTPALLAAAARGAAPARQAVPATRSYLIRYSFAALDALAGYAAGLPQPAYYDFLWRRAQEDSGGLLWRQVAVDLIGGFAQRARQDGHPIATPQQVEMARAAETLARLRGRPGALRHDLLDAARTALVKGEAARHDAWSERLILFLRGEAIGDIPAGAGSPPLVEHARALARAHRIDVSDGARRNRSLDIRRKPAHLAASRFLHAMDLLGTGFAQRTAGPDYLNGRQTDVLFEEWSYAWSPAVEGRLIEQSVRADRLDAACLAVLKARREALRQAGTGGDLVALVELLCQGLLAGLGRELMPFVADLAQDLSEHPDFTAVARALRHLYSLTTTAGPLAVPPGLDLAALTRAGYLQLVYLCDDLPNTTPEAAPGRVEALRTLVELLGADTAGVFDRSLFDAAIDRVAGARAPPEILGAVLGICVQSGRRDPEQLCAALRGRFAGAVLKEEERIGALRGLVLAAPQALWSAPGVLDAVDGFLHDLTDDVFFALLPHLRLAFAALNPREIDQLGERLAARHGGPSGAFAAHHATVTQGDLARGLMLEQTIRAAAERDGLTRWLTGEDPA